MAFKKDLHILDDLWDEIEDYQITTEKKKIIIFHDMKDIHNYNLIKLYIRQYLYKFLPIEIINIILSYIGTNLYGLNEYFIQNREYKYTYTDYGCLSDYAYKYHRTHHSTWICEGMVFNPQFNDFFEFIEELEKIRWISEWWEEEDSYAGENHNVYEDFED